MIRIINSDKLDITEFLSDNYSKNDLKVEKAVEDILNDVKARGDEAVRLYNKKFDNCDVTDLLVSEAEISEAYNSTDERFIEVLRRAEKNITEYHEWQKLDGFDKEKDGIKLGQRVLPLERVGLYVPGGTASYPSTVLMSAIPAKVAGVKEIVMVSPPVEDGKIRKEILVAAKIAGVSQIYKAGGAQSIAALAFGTQSLKKVNKIVGPGNIFVATAKRRVFGTVDIDMIAGPSEMLIIADSTAVPAYVAADMLSQAEHDVLSRSIMITTDAALADAVAAQLEVQLKELPRKSIAERAICDNSVIIVAKDLTQAAYLSDLIAPEHLELCVESPFELMELTKNAGSIFLGNYSPEPLGDYYAGPNHTLPTLGTARFSSPLSTYDFVKKNSYIYYSQDALKKVADDVEYFAEKEGLTAHANSIKIRGANK